MKQQERSETNAPYLYKIAEHVAGADVGRGRRQDECGDVR